MEDRLHQIRLNIDKEFTFVSVISILQAIKGKPQICPKLQLCAFDLGGGWDLINIKLF